MVADPFVLLLAAHFAGDYLLQDDHIAEHKAEKSGKGWRANLTHVGHHVAATFALFVAAQLAVGLDFSAVGVFAAVAWVGCSHGLIDRRWPVEWWMRHTGSTEFIARGGAPLVDQAMHIVLGITPAALLIAALS